MNLDGIYGNIQLVVQMKNFKWIFSNFLVIFPTFLVSFFIYLFSFFIFNYLFIYAMRRFILNIIYINNCILPQSVAYAG